MSDEDDQIITAGRGDALLADDLEVGAPWTIHGVALGPEDVTIGSSGLKKLWPADELRRAASSLEGKPLVRDHLNTVDGVVGEVTKADYRENVGVVYEAELTDESLAEKIQHGLLEVSARMRHAPVSDLEEEDDALVVEDIEFLNLSLVSQGASPSNEVDVGAATALQAAELASHFDYSPREAEAELEQSTDEQSESENPTMDEEIEELRKKLNERNEQIEELSSAVEGLKDAQEEESEVQLPEELEDFSDLMELRNPKAIEECEDPMVVDSAEYEELESKADEAESVKAILAEHVAELSPFEKDELMEKFTFSELQGKADEFDFEEELAPAPQSGDPDEEELEENEEEAEEAEAELEELREKQEWYESVGWNGQAEELADEIAALEN